MPGCPCPLLLDEQVPRRRRSGPLAAVALDRACRRPSRPFRSSTAPAVAPVAAPIAPPTTARPAADDRPDHAAITPAADGTSASSSQLVMPARSHSEHRAVARRCCPPGFRVSSMRPVMLDSPRWFREGQRRSQARSVPVWRRHVIHPVMWPGGRGAGGRRRLRGSRCASPPLDSPQFVRERSPALGRRPSRC